MTDTDRFSPAVYNIGFTEEEIGELILLIDDAPVDEDFLREIRRKLKNKRQKLRARTGNQASKAP